MLRPARLTCAAPCAGEACDSALKKLTDRDVHPICRIPLITNSREEQQLISQSHKPVVKLLINRHNNKYSYTRCVPTRTGVYSSPYDTFV